MTGLTTQWGCDRYTVAAEDWADANHQVMTMDVDGDWITTGTQVGDFRHDCRAALRAQLQRATDYDGLAGAEAEMLIDEAVDEADVYVNRENGEAVLVTPKTRKIFRTRNRLLNTRKHSLCRKNSFFLQLMT